MAIFPEITTNRTNFCSFTSPLLKPKYTIAKVEKIAKYFEKSIKKNFILNISEVFLK